jgi:thiol:disulfide interchange protein
MSKTMKRLAIIAAVVLLAYFAQVEINTYLGKRALAEMGLEPLPLTEAFAKAKQDSKLVLADLSAIWCPSCRKLDKQVLSHVEVKRAIAEKYVYARIEYESEDGKVFQKRYNVQGFPHLLILDPTGEVVRHLPVTFDPEAFAKQL